MGTPPIRLPIQKFEHDVNERGAIVRLTDPTWWTKLNALPPGVFVKPIAEALDNSLDVQLSGSLENYVEQHFLPSTRAASNSDNVPDGARFQSSAKSDSVRPFRGGLWMWEQSSRLLF